MKYVYKNKSSNGFPLAWEIRTTTIIAASPVSCPLSQKEHPPQIGVCHSRACVYAVCI